MSLYKVNIVVFKSEPLDLQRYRHTAIDTESVDDGSRYVFHVVGASPQFTFESRTGRNPEDSTTFVKKIPVGTTTIRLSPEQLRSAMRTVPVRNSDPEFNCHGWVEGALALMRDAGYITAAEYSRSIDEMVKTTLEAKDEPGN